MYTMKSGQEQIEIEKVSSVIMVKALKFSGHISTKIIKANHNLDIIFRTFYIHGQRNVSELIQIYCKTSFGIRHHCVYASFQEGYDRN